MGDTAARLNNYSFLFAGVVTVLIVKGKYQPLQLQSFVKVVNWGEFISVDVFSMSQQLN